ncbi:MAG: hypothetical protein QME25_04870 [Bacteroidota bacterium]|nr:hypothetical protein [Bacteroidota bacterium]
MLRLILSFIIFIHGLIHILGFVKEWQLAEISQLTGKTLFPLSGSLPKTVGVLWLFVCLLFIVSAASFLQKKEWWWMIACVAIIVSQILIIIYWQEAKFGTIASIIILVACFLSYGNWSFNRMVNDEINSFLSNIGKEKKVVTFKMINNLPPVVQKWLVRSKIIGKEIIQTVHLKQNGEMRTKPDGSWMSVEAEQYFTTEKPGFIWLADVQAAPFIHLFQRKRNRPGRFVAIPG